MLMHGTGPLRAAYAAGTALGAFTTYGLELTEAIVAAATDEQVPVLLSVGSSAFAYTAERPLVALALAAAEDAAVPVGVHLDHSRDLDEVDRCLAAGYTSVMVDGSHLPFRDNIALTRAAAVRAHAAGAWVEGELGRVVGAEDRSTGAVAVEGTDPDAAAEFVAATGVDALAVAVGNVHGFTAAPVRLDLDRLRALRSRVPVPLVLHGASGLAPDDLRAAVRLGAAKVNVNAEVRRAFLAGIPDPASVGDDVTALLRPARAAARDAVRRTLRQLRSAHRATEPAR